MEKAVAFLWHISIYRQGSPEINHRARFCVNPREILNILACPSVKEVAKTLTERGPCSQSSRGRVRIPKLETR